MTSHTRPRAGIRLFCFNLFTFAVLIVTARTCPAGGRATAPSVPAPRAASADDLHDITNIEPAPPAPPGSRWSARTALGLGVGAVLLAGLAGLGWAWMRRTGRRTVPLPPDQWALRELECVEGLALPEAGALEQHYTLISDIVRRYLELRFGFPATEQTTAEILRTLCESGELPDAEQSLLGSFLGRCDVAKFAGVAGTAEEGRGSMDRARQFIQHTSSPSPSTQSRSVR